MPRRKSPLILDPSFLAVSQTQTPLRNFVEVVQRSQKKLAFLLLQFFMLQKQQKSFYSSRQSIGN